MAVSTLVAKLACFVSPSLYKLWLGIALPQNKEVLEEMAMRSYWAPLAFIGLSLAAHGLWGQSPPPLQAPSPYPAAAYIVASQADVYSGPGENYYPTSRLRANERVTILAESRQPGWLVIAPPPGSFSWIEAKYVKTVAGMDRFGIVETGDPKVKAPVMPGSSVVNREPNVEACQVENGTLLVVLDRPTSAGAVSFYPIMPVGKDYRYLRADAIRNAGAYTSNNAGYGNSYGNPYGNATVPTNWQTTAPATPYYVLGQQADQQLAAGNYDRARLLYIEALAAGPDERWRPYLTSQLAKIPSSGSPQGSPLSGGAYQGGAFQTGSSPANARPIPNWNTTATPPVGGVSAPPAAPPANMAWSPWGILRGTGITTREGQPLYVIESQNGAVLKYVTTQPTFSLNAYLGQMIAVFGTLVNRSDLNINGDVLVAERIATPPPGK
jgi:hypothetical protein